MALNYPEVGMTAIVGVGGTMMFSIFDGMVTFKDEDNRVDENRVVRPFTASPQPTLVLPELRAVRPQRQITLAEE